MDSSYWLSIVENLNLLLHTARNCKSLYRELDPTDNAFFLVNALDVDQLADVFHFDVHELTRWPSWVFTAVDANC